MRLVTFAASGRERIGALIDNDRKIVDFMAAQDGAGPTFQNMQALIESGAAALDRGREIVAAAPRNGRGVIDAASVKLLAPLPLPPQLRDFLCFEKHLIQAYTQILRIRAASAPDPKYFGEGLDQVFFETQEVPQLRRQRQRRQQLN